MYSQALGGIRLKVHPNDLDAVTAILENLNNRLTIV
jgi:flagellar biosynthesis/type III secretory pathway protein FliH